MAGWPEPVHQVDGQLQRSLLLTVAEACAELRVSRPQLYILANKQHVIEMMHIGKLCRIPRESLESYVASLRQRNNEDRLATRPELELES